MNTIPYTQLKCLYSIMGCVKRYNYNVIECFVIRQSSGKKNPIIYDRHETYDNADSGDIVFHCGQVISNDNVLLIYLIIYLKLSLVYILFWTWLFHRSILNLLFSFVVVFVTFSGTWAQIE